MTQRLLCLAANPSIDRLIEVPRLRLGAIHRPSVVRAVAGGKGLNVARAAARLGADASAVAILGGHAGRWIADRLAEEGVRAQVAWTEGETRVSISIADRAERRLTELYEAGEPVSGETIAAFVALVRDELNDPTARPAWLTMSGSLPPGAPVQLYGTLCEMAEAAGVPTLVDADGPVLAAALNQSPTIVKANAAEAAGILRIAEPPDTASAVAAAVAICRLGAAGAIVTIGRRGAGAVLDGKRWWVGPAPVLGRYPVASGDAFTAGVVLGLAQGSGPSEALRLGAAAAAANALVAGAAVFDPEAVVGLASQVEVRQVGRSGPALGGRR